MMSISAESKLVMYADDILLGLLGKHLTINFCSRMLKHLENGLTITIWRLIPQNRKPWYFQSADTAIVDKPMLTENSD